MANKNKNKGKAWERDICDILSSNLGGSFTRVPNSGAYIGGFNNYRRNALSNTQIMLSKGDIIPPDNLSKMVIEAKSYKEFPFHQLITKGDCKQLDEWITQTLDCVEIDNIWFVIFKINNKSSYIVFKKEYNNIFKLENYCIYKDFIVTEFKPFVEQNVQEIIKLCS